MILADANLLISAYNSDAPQHEAARTWLEGVFSSELLCLSWQTITAFLRITTNPRAFAAPFSIEEAAEIVNAWLQRPAVTVLAPGERHWQIFAELLRRDQAAGSLVMDAHLAALAIEHGAILYTTDRDFARFGSLTWENPLATAGGQSS